MKHPESRTLSTRAAVIIPCLASIAGFVWLTSHGMAVLNAIVTSVCGGAVLAGMLVLGTGKRLEDLQQGLNAKPAGVIAVIAVLWGLYFLYSIGTNTAHFQPLAVMAIYVFLPFLLLANNRGASQGTWPDALTILWIWLPIELGILRRLLVTSAPNTDFHYAFAEGLAINLGITAFAAWRRLPGIGYRFEFTRRVVWVGLLCFLLFSAIAIPVGEAIHFIRYSFELSKLVLAPGLLLGVFLFTALPEELLFRGLIQNWLHRVTYRRSVSLLLASIIFGASHLNNGPPIPNYKYFLMATIAGIFYGFAWQATGSLAASAITHALVDTAWTVFFR